MFFHGLYHKILSQRCVKEAYCIAQKSPEKTSVFQTIILSNIPVSCYSIRLFFLNINRNNFVIIREILFIYAYILGNIK
ncbi:MAG: hypothetical protein A2Y17_05330 [Clostridiales bacterium GWF2_38_85]|nr:MAG: hypothetical protein A2Y17_05330 [Clostridiales bacterium GWF2_38_85]HBL83348.1 hypothetical protein [Clostridiales bacterium]